MAKRSKQCANCAKRKPLNEFSNHWKTADGKNPWCKPCNSKRIKAARKRNKGGFVEKVEKVNEVLKVHPQMNHSPELEMLLSGLRSEGVRRIELQRIVIEK